MMDDESPKTSDEEYHFSDLETSDLYGSDEQGGAGAATRTKKMRRVLFIFGIVIILFLAYKIFDVFLGAPTTQKKAPAPVQQPALPRVPVQTIQPIASVPAPAEVDAIQRVQTDVNDIKNSLADLQGTLSTLNYSLQGLTEQMKQQQTILESQEKLLKVLQPKPKAKPKTTRAITKKRKLYYVDAMIPGRAWLKTRNGDETITVSEGDKILGYQGVVVQIDANAGEVVMSSGQIIRYKEDER